MGNVKLMILVPTREKKGFQKHRIENEYWIIVKRQYLISKESVEAKWAMRARDNSL